MSWEKRIVYYAYIVKHENTHDSTQSLPFLQMLIVTDFVTLRMSKVNPSLLYVCKHVHVYQTKCGADSLFQIRGGFQKRWIINLISNLILNKTRHWNLGWKDWWSWWPWNNTPATNPNRDFSTELRTIFQPSENVSRSEIDPRTLELGPRIPLP